MVDVQKEEGEGILLVGEVKDAPWVEGAYLEAVPGEVVK